MKRIVLTAVLIACATGCQSDQGPPDTILVNGKIFTADLTQPTVEAVAIRGEYVSAVGTNAEIEAVAGPETRRIDLGGRVAIPGINDAHTHFIPSEAGVHLLGPFSAMDPPWPEVRDALASAVEAVDEGASIVGTVGIQVIDDPSVTRFLLDSIAPDHVVFLRAYYGHGDILNTSAMQEWEIAETAPDPPGGFYGRIEGTDRLNGKLFEYAQWRLTYLAGAQATRSGLVADLKALSAEALRFGITSIQNMPIMPTDLYVEALAEADIPLRVRVIRMPVTDASGRLVDEGASLPRHPGGNERITVRGVKWILDGTPLERGSAQRSAYADRPDWSGRTNFPASEIGAIIRESLERDEPLLLHITGDRTTEIVFDTMEAMVDVDWPARRVRIEHGEGVAEDLIARAARLGVIVVQNPTHFALGPVMLLRWGGPDAPFQRFRTLDEAGIPIALGSDGVPNPFLNIMLASVHPTFPSEAISRERAVVAYTRDAAFAEFEEHRKGSLAVGMLADIAVLSQDIFAEPPPALPATESVLTIIGGEIAYDAGVLEANRD